MTCEERLKKLMAACEKVLADNNVIRPWEKGDWRAVDYACFMDEEEAWETLKKVFVEVEEEK